jgi:hypothetical protein
MAHLIDVVIDERVFLDIGVAGWDIGLWLVIIVITHKKFDCILREKLLKFPVELGCQGLVMGNDQGGSLYPLNYVGHGEGLSGAGDSQKDLLRSPLLNPLAQGVNGLRLIAFGLEFRNEFKSIHFIMILQQRQGRWKDLVRSKEFGVRRKFF